MASLPFSSTKETTNYARLCRLLIDVGSQVLRGAFDRIHPQNSLPALLARPDVHTKLQSLWKKRLINPAQWDKLYPAIASSVSSAHFDVTLLIVLFRNICNLHPPGTGWDVLPFAADKSLEADIARVKYYRNTVYAHASEASVDDATFAGYWQEIREILVRLGGAGTAYGEAIDRLANDSMDPDVENHYQELLKEWKKDDDSMKDKLDEIEKILAGLTRSEKRTRLTEPFDLKECQKQLHSLYSTICKVKTIPWKRKSAIHIDKIYTKLTWQRDDAKPSGVEQEEMKDYTDMFKSCEHYSEPNRILVCGPPGIGKTTFAKRVVFDWSHQGTEILKKFNLVLLIRLRDVCDLCNVPDILMAAKLLPADGMISVDSLYEYILKNQEKVLLVLDGYDEYSCAGKHSPIRDIWEGTLLRDCHVIVTTRLEEADELTVSSRVECHINGFVSDKQVRKFASKFLKDEDDVDKFVRHLKEKDLRSIAEIPLLLVMLCLLWKEEDHRGEPKSRANIYTHFIQTLLDHMTEKEGDAKKFGKVDDYKEDLFNLGKLAFDALLQDSLFLHYSELLDDILTTKLIDAGLFQILNVASLNPEKGVYFIHKSVQEFLAAWYVKEELSSSRNESSNCLSEVESSERIVKMIEVFKFVNELSTEASCTVLNHLQMVGKNERLMEDNFSDTPSVEDLSEKQRHFLALCSHSYFCSSAEKRHDLYSVFLSCIGGVLLLNSEQLHIIANEHLLKFCEAPNYAFFTDSKHPEQDYCDLITVLEDLNGLLGSCSGEVEASILLKKYAPRSVEHFFLKKEDNLCIYLYLARIYKWYDYPFPVEMLKDVTQSSESTQAKNSVGDESNGQNNTTALRLTENTDCSSVPIRHCLSLAWEVRNEYLEEQEMKMLIEVLPFVISPRVITINGPVGKRFDAHLIETLVSRINFTNRLDTLALWRLNVTAKPAAAIARSLHQAPNLRELYLSYNALGKGISVLAEHLSCVPLLRSLRLGGVKMTEKQVSDLSTAVRQSNISSLGSYYHDEEGNPKPEHEWPLEDFWKEKWWHVPEDELEPGTST